MSQYVDIVCQWSLWACIKFRHIFTQSYPPVPRDVLLRFWQGVPVPIGSHFVPSLMSSRPLAPF